MELLNVLVISKQIGGTFVLNGVSFSQKKLRKIAIAGETGSGKSTLLRIIGGLVQPDAGEVLFENVRIKGPAEKLIPGHPAIAYLSQQFELANNYRVEEVLSYANKLSEEDAFKIFEVCQIDHLLKRRTDQVSGGEKQRIAVARLLISSPRLLLLDEPYSNLDMVHKNILRTVIDDIGKRLDITCMLVSHDPIDILSWADEIIVLKDGQTIQKGPPENIYRQPINEYVAGLFGRYNLVDYGLAEMFHSLPGIQKNDGQLFIRPEDFKIVDKTNKLLEGTITRIIFSGSHYEIEIQLPGSMITVKTGDSDFRNGDTVYVSVDAKRVWYME